MIKHVDFEPPDWGELAQGPAPWDAYAQAVLALGPVAYWRFGELSGSVAHDVLQAHDGAYTGGVTFGSDGAIFRDADTASAFDGVDGRVTVPHSAALNLAGNTAASWLLWARKAAPASDAGRWLIGKGQAHVGALRFLIELRGDDGRIVLAANDGAWRTASSNAGLTFDGWRLVTLTWDGQDTIAHYLDGQPVGTAAFQPGWFPANASDLTLAAAHASGVNAAMFHFAGDLDEIALFNKAITAQQIAQLYDRGVGTFRLPL